MTDPTCTPRSCRPRLGRLDTPAPVDASAVCPACELARQANRCTASVRSANRQTSDTRVADVARPARRAETLHAGISGATQQPRALSGPRAALALGKRLLAIEVECVVQRLSRARVQLDGGRWTFPTVQPPAVDAQID